MKNIKSHSKFINEKQGMNPNITYNEGDTLICKKTFGESAISNSHFYRIGNEYKINKIVDLFNTGKPRYEMSFYGVDKKGVERDIIDFYPLMKSELDLFFDKK